MKIILLTFLFAFSTVYAAKSKKTQAPASLPEYLTELKDMPLNLVSDEAFKASRTFSSEKAKRYPSGQFEDLGVKNNVQVSINDVSPQFLAFTNEFLALKTADEFYSFLKKTEKEYDQYPPDVQYAATLLLVMKPFRGFLFRVEGLFDEKRGWAYSKKESILKSLFSNVQIFIPSNQWKAALDYVNIPDSYVQQFKKVSDLQNYLYNYGTVSLRFAIRRLETIRAKMIESKKDFFVDKQILFGSGAFKDTRDRVRMMGLPEMEMQIAMMYGNLHVLNAFVSYNQDDGIAIVNELANGRIVGTSIPVLEQDDAFSTKETVDIIMAKNKIGKALKYPKFLTLRDSVSTIRPYTGKQTMSDSYDALKQAVYFQRQAWTHILERQGTQAHFITDVTLKFHHNKVESGLTEIEALLEGEGFKPVRSIVTGNVMELNLKAFFKENPPQDLKQFLPNKFEMNPGKWVETVDGVKYRNHRFGRANGWNNDSYKPYLVVKDSDTNEIVSDALRIFMQSWSGNGIRKEIDAIWAL